MVSPKPVNRLNLHIDTIIDSHLPRNYHQDLRDPNLLNAMKEEFNAIISNKTWVLVPAPPDANIVNCIWLFKKKFNADGYLAPHGAHMAYLLLYVDDIVLTASSTTLIQQILPRVVGRRRCDCTHLDFMLLILGNSVFEQ
ncbi:hypothetical protein Lser_V15G45812 [Lactuca serriola]